MQSSWKYHNIANRLHSNTKQEVLKMPIIVSDFILYYTKHTAKHGVLLSFQ